MQQLLDMLNYMRPEGSNAQRLFCKKYLEPVFGEPDEDGNYFLLVGSKYPKIAFMAHHDTVHKDQGFQRIHVSSKGHVSLAEKNWSRSCLGADCTTGVYIILRMIEADVPGVYIIHAGEEIGCVGSKALAQRRPPYLDKVEAAISFDRYGTTSIITHQMGERTCSDEFATSLSSTLGMPYLTPDPTGAFTDSIEYIHFIPECTNISVGYYNQHSVNESQDLNYLEELIGNLIDADWGALDIARDPRDMIFRSSLDPWGDNYYNDSVGYQSAVRAEISFLAELCSDYPEEVADLLRNVGYDAASLLEDLSINPTSHDLNRMLEANY